MRQLLVRLLLTVTAGVVPAFSDTVVIFDNRSSEIGGTFSYATSGNGIASLSGGTIDQVSAHDGVNSSYAVSGLCGAGPAPDLNLGCLNFTTGALISSVVSGSTITYTYAAGGSLTIVGSADGGTGTLYTATSGFASPVTLTYNTATNLAAISSSLTAGLLNPALAASLGVVAQTPGGTNTGSAFNIVLSGSNGSGVESTNSVQLTAAAVTTPEPASMSMIGAGLLAVGLLKRRRRSLSV